MRGLRLAKNPDYRRPGSDSIGEGSQRLRFILPRGGFIMLTPLFLAIGLPAEGIGILIAVDAIPDTFASALNSTGSLAAVAIVGRKTAALG